MRNYSEITMTGIYRENGNKKEQVQQMFDRIAPRYDFLNHLLSLGIDRTWRKRLMKILKAHQPQHILDVATGTADLALAARELNPVHITGIDISEKMLSIARNKIRQSEASSVIRVESGDAENLRFTDHAFDTVMVAFGVRNFANLKTGLCEMYRVLKPGGLLLVLEFAHPARFPVKQLYSFYFHRILPLIGKIVSKDNSAYRYLPQSVDAFPSGNDFLRELANCGFIQTKFTNLTFGIAAIYEGRKA